jgi:membrane protein implicated in regulation of membrane protease activity
MILDVALGIVLAVVLLVVLAVALAVLIRYWYVWTGLGLLTYLLCTSNWQALVSWAIALAVLAMLLKSAERQRERRAMEAKAREPRH